MSEKVFVVGVGMTKFEKPGSRDWDYPDMAREAGTNALEDAGLKLEDIEQAAVGYCYGDSTAGERGFYELGHTGIPIYNVNNNCSTGSTALFMAKQFVAHGAAAHFYVFSQAAKHRWAAVRTPHSPGHAGC